MCNFISWIEYEGEVYYLTNGDLATKEGKKLLQERYRDDIEGHGAIEHYYPELKGKGVHKECEDFSSPKNFPKEIARDLIKGRLSRIGIAVDILNEEGEKKYDEVERTAWEKYLEVERTAKEKYLEVERTAWEKYLEVKRTAWEKYFEVKSTAKEKYQEVERTAKEKYLEVERTAWVEIVKQKKYRKKEWKVVK